MMYFRMVALPMTTSSRRKDPIRVRPLGVGSSKPIVLADPVSVLVDRLGEARTLAAGLKLDVTEKLIVMALLDLGSIYSKG